MAAVLCPGSMSQKGCFGVLMQGIRSPSRITGGFGGKARSTMCISKGTSVKSQVLKSHNLVYQHPSVLYPITSNLPSGVYRTLGGIKTVL